MQHIFHSHQFQHKWNELWAVEDNFIAHPECKIQKNTSPYIEATVESWGTYQFENAKAPPDMLAFVEMFVRMLGIVPSQYSTVHGLCNDVMRHLEYSQPYYFTIDMPISLLNDAELTNTYRHRATGHMLDPSRIEIFQYVRGWEFTPYNVVKNMLEHPGMQHFLRSGQLPPMYKTREEALVSILNKVSEVVYGRFGWLEEFVEEVVGHHEEALIYDTHPATEIDRGEISDHLSRDWLFWLAGSLAVMTWFRGPKALPFLIQYHILYDQLLEYDDTAGTVREWAGTGGEAIVDCTNVYTHKQVEKVANRLPDTCSCCNVSTHCTKYLNLSAIQFPTCSCGQPVDPFETDNAYSGHSRLDCRPYASSYPIKAGYLCQRCLFKAINRIPGEVQCGRAACPATKCQHHMGIDYRLRALTQQRTHQLTSQQKS